MGHAAYVIFCQAVELRQCTLLVLIDSCPVSTELGVLFTKNFDILPEIIIEYQF